MSEWIPWAKPDYWGREREMVLDALESSWISGGPYVERLEREFASVTGARHALAVANGTAAIHLAYLGAGLRPGDEVVVPGFAFMAAANVALHMGARPVFAEIDPNSWCVSAETIAPCLTDKTRLIVAVHTYGNVCDMDAINALAAPRGIPVIEDAAESFGSRLKGRHAGTMSFIGTYSFHATKTITTGEGGMVVTADPGVRDRMALYRSHGMGRTRYLHEVAGHNFRMTNLQAALGCAQLERLDRIVSERRRVHALYRRHLGSESAWRLQTFAPEVDPVLWAIALLLDLRAFQGGRDAVMDGMKAAGIETRPGFYAASQMGLYSTRPLPTSEDTAARVISLPTYPTLTEDQIGRICSALKGLKRQGRG